RPESSKRRARGWAVPTRRSGAPPSQPFHPAGCQARWRCSSTPWATAPGACAKRRGPARPRGPSPPGAGPRRSRRWPETATAGRRNAAVEALAAIGKPAVVPLLTALRAGGEHRKLIVDALGAIGDPQAVEPLCTAMEGSDENLRAAAAEALGRIGGPRVADALVSALHHEDLMTRLAALESLARIGAQ